MTDIKFPSEKKSCSLYLSEDNLDTLALIALDQNCSQSKAASNLIKQAAKDEQQRIELISTRLYNSWSNTKQGFDQYLKSVGPWLFVKKIGVRHTKEIINNLKAIHDSRK